MLTLTARFTKNAQRTQGKEHLIYLLSELCE